MVYQQRISHISSAPDVSASPLPYTFTDAELDTLCRWYSALKHAFPEADIFMVVSHRNRFSMIAVAGLNGRSVAAGTLFKRVSQGVPEFSWHTEADIAFGPTATLSEITDRHIAAVGCPSEEREWLDHSGWETVLRDQTVYEIWAHSPRRDPED